MPQSTINLAQTTKRPLHEVLVIELARVSATHILQLDSFELKRTLEICLKEINYPILYPNLTYDRWISKVTRINSIMQCQLLYTNYIIEKFFYKYITIVTYEARSAHSVYIIFPVKLSWKVRINYVSIRHKCCDKSYSTLVFYAYLCKHIQAIEGMF